MLLLSMNAPFITLRTVFLTVSLAVLAAEALKCHVVPVGNLSAADTSQPQECGIGSLTCVKVVDFTRGTYTKQCLPWNCTMNGIANSVGHCQKTLAFGIEGMVCCCYGDACNGAPTSITVGVTALVSLVVAFFAV